HFLREMGQLYEAAVSLPENVQSRQQMLHLPRLCAELMLDGFPLELVDGDASNIPLRWVSDVLLYLNSLVQPNNKIMVVTVLGVQSTGKSTLLNTMFGVQFAVSSGRCTRGAFMQLIKVKEDIKKELGCDYLVIIDTEGLKSPELAKLDDSHEHDNELATLVVGLSDITIINIAMENSTEMKDILQIVVHAFLRMKEIGKKPNCQFVHQNVADVSAHDKNMRDRKLLLEQLNEMTEAAAKMENKEDYKMFTDVMEYDPETCNWYIPGLWHGNPPMAPVNAGYSEAIYDLKKNMIDVIGKCKQKTSGNNISEFLEWTKSLWNAVKYENFIFSFRNSLVADAYMRLNIFDSVYRQLRENMKQKGSSVAEQLITVNLMNCGTGVFKATNEIFLKRWFKHIINDNSAMKLQDLADNIIQTCSPLVLDKTSDYHDAYIQEILHIADNRLKSNKNMGFSVEFELSLKLYICGFSARAFQDMHDRFIKENDPRRCLDQYKDKYRDDFKDLFHDRDQCQRKAEEFTTLCLIPAVETFIYRSLGPDIVDKMLQGKNAFQFSTRAFFQYSLLKQLVNEDKFEQYVKYISSYEGFVKGWILDQITKQFSNHHEMSELEERHLRGISKEILEAVKMAQNETNEDGIKGFIHCICRKLGQKLIIPKDALETVMVFNNASQEPFACWLTKSVEEMEHTMMEQLKKVDIQGKLCMLKMKPQDELFKRVFGCGQQCPFCSAPCEAGGEAHTDHCASVHRPQGLGRYRHENNKKLVTDICSTDVHSEVNFKCFQTNYNPHPYKRYREIFPDWHIPADASIQASDYWKYVMARFNTMFAEENNARPADIPLTWKFITKQQAENSLKESFSIK
ncbi:interferon-induced very large GTPase 1-like, partial [Sinocyclocheilus grahami]|uniref:interferon-induced very large GTPase 1-like n=1 Tax=Sinocyclocheilus grahami TaxID=75366 RepID=UPI0007AC5ABB